jgi:DNA-binding CsgD family transcriptional regulator
MNNSNNNLFTSYGSVNITFRYGDLHVCERNTPKTVANSARALPVTSSPPRSPLAPEVASLSPRQREVLSLLVQGSSNKEIARALNMRVGTVKIHVTSIFHKLGVTSRTAAAVAGVRLLAGQDRSAKGWAAQVAQVGATYLLGPSGLAVAA